MSARPQHEHPIYETQPVLSIGFVTAYAEYLWAAEQCAGLARVLDIGCNNGFGTEIIGGQCRHVTGVDVIPEAIEYCRKKYADRPEFSFELVKEGTLDFPENTFDSVVASNLIEHLKDPGDFLGNIHRVLRPGGKLVLSTTNRNVRLYFWQKPFNPFHYREYTPASLRKELSHYFGEITITGVRTHGRYFPDYLKRARSRKFRNAIVYPFRRALTRYVRPVFSALVPGRFPAPALDAERTVKIRKPAARQVASYEDSEFVRALNDIYFSGDRLESAKELCAIAYKR